MSFNIFCYAIMSIRLHNLHRHTRLPVFSLGKHQCLQQTGRRTGNHSHFIQQRTQQYMATHTSLNFLSSPSIMLFMKFLTKRTSPYLIISFLSPVRERGMRWTDGKTWSQSWNLSLSFGLCTWGEMWGRRSGHVTSALQLLSKDDVMCWGGSCCWG